MRFTKMQGLGNDYIYVDCFADPPPANPAALARRISDRHFGIGGDGLILICRSEQADAQMRMFNADGSEAEMCGNGIRCVAKYVYDHGLVRKQRLSIETGAGVRTLDLTLDDGHVSQVRVDMGEPKMAAGEVPVALPSVARTDTVVDHQTGGLVGIDAAADWVRESGLDLRMTCVSMGNPHAVFFCRDVNAIPLEQVGPRIEHATVFPNRVNAHFVAVHDRGEVTARTWERGSGITSACGTGASAICVAAAKTGRTDRRIIAHLPGGDLELEWAADNHVYMTGPAVEVFSGVWLDQDGR